MVVLPLLALSSLPRRSPGQVGLAVLPLLLVAGIQVALAITGHPSLEEATALVQRRELEGALFVAAACADLGIHPEQAAKFHDNLQLDRIRQIGDPQQAWQALEWPFRTEAGRRRAAEHAVEITARTADSSQTAGDWQGSEELLSLVPRAYQDQPPILQVRWGLLANEVESRWNVIRSREAPLEDRLEECLWLSRILPSLDSLGPPPRPAPVDQDQADKVCKRLRAEQHQEIERQRREEERDRKRQELQEAAAHRAWAYAPLLCRDGTLSPSCVCGQSSRRGCCSHHGGVEGCSAAYP